jgi:hypothetical protein
MSRRRSRVALCTDHEEPAEDEAGEYVDDEV